jgi:hypothetical protein
VKLVVDGYQHVVPDDETGEHQVRDGGWCWCAPTERDLPLYAAEREGYTRVVYHASSGERTMRAQRLA